jgi:hypothetical protein
MYTPVILALTIGLAAPVAGQPGGCEDEILTRVVDGTILISHNGSEYNCCPERFDYQVEVGAGQIVVTETEILEVPCDCICCFDLGLRIEDVPPGAYTLVFRWYDYGQYLWVEQSVVVIVPDEGQGEQPQVTGLEQSDCYWGPTAVPPEPGPGLPPEPVLGTWGLVKAMYR